jgi:hypothetical protein
MNLLRLALRGWLMVALVSLNTIQIAHGRLLPAMVVGYAISWLRWTNSSKDRCNAKGACHAYAAGAALGTLTGMWIGWTWG